MEHQLDTSEKPVILLNISILSIAVTKRKVPTVFSLCSYHQTYEFMQ